MSGITDEQINPQTKKTINFVASNPPHAVLLHGDEGAGKFYLANALADMVIGNDQLAKSQKHYILPENNSITIDQVRHIKDLVKLKVPGAATIRRVIIIQDAHCMREEAQNALLKTLEEPPEDTLFILTAYAKEMLLETVVSRTTPVLVRPISLEQAKNVFPNITSEKIARAYYMSNGNVGLLSALVNEADHPLIDHMERAKRILSSTVYDRLCMVEDLKNDKVALRHTLYCMRRILHFKLRQSPNAQTIRYARAVVQAEADNNKNVQPRLILTDLFIKL